ncbi:MAG: tectonin domain-containing protein [Nostoc sp.]|uniref:tectonin domain-containing protein n=1 Tax=Nostoc sp. TaxID=1180 RepID=UPI002FF8678E
MRLSKFRIFIAFALTALVSGVFTLPTRAKEPIQTQNFRPLLIAQSSTDISEQLVTSQNVAFTQIQGVLTQISVGADSTAWGINSANQIFVFNNVTQSFQQIQ